MISSTACMRPRVGTHQLGTHRPRDGKYQRGIVHEQTFGDTSFEDVFFLFVKQMLATSQQSVSATPNQNSDISTIKKFLNF
jgi:hypothetical protein